MSITSMTQVRNGGLTTVTVVSDLSPGAGQAIQYFWYVDGAFVKQTTASAHDFRLEPGEQVRVDVLDSLDAGFDAVANAPSGYPARRTIQWVRSDADPTAIDAQAYLAEQQKDGGTWTEIARVKPAEGQWQFAVLSPRLVDGSTYAWRITPIDAAGNEGTVITIDNEKMIRTPDAPDFTISFDDATQRISFQEAA